MRAILTYHSIDPSGSPISVAEDTFRRQVTWLASTPIVRVVSVEELLSLPDEVDAVALTFDDAFENFRERAWPLLREYGLPATLFVVTGHVGRTNEWGGRSAPGIPVLDLMTWKGIRTVASEGVTLGSHTVNHPRLSALDDDQLRVELQRARTRLREETGVDTSIFAYPYGDVDPRVVDAASEEYQTGVTTRLASMHPRDVRLLLPRLDMFYFQRPGQLEGWGSARFGRYVWMRRQLRDARRLVASRKP